MAWRADVAANCLDLFDIIPPAHVAEEIQTPDPRLPGGEFPYATLFRHLRDKMSDPPNPEPAPISALGRGEAAAIALAAHLRTPLLLNESRAKTFASRLGLDVITVPAVIVALFSREVVGGRAARRKLELIEANTAPRIIGEALTALTALGG